MSAAAFEGRWVLSTAAGAVVAVVDQKSGSLGLAPLTTPPAPDQCLNVYGDATSGAWLQGGNGAYLVGTADGWAASATPATPPATFVVQPVSGSTCRVREASAGGEYYLAAAGGELARLRVSDNPPDGTVFTQVIVTPGLADLKASDAFGDDLRWVSFAAADLTDIRLIGCDLSDATLAGATVTGANLQNCTVNRTDLSGLDLDGVVATGLQGDTPNFTGARLHRSTNLQGADLPNAIFARVTSSGRGLASGPAMGNMTAPDADFSGAHLVGLEANGSTLTGADFTGADLSDGQLAGVDFSRASMDHVILSRTVLSQSVFDEAHLVGAEFRDAQITDCSFVAATLTNARLSGVKPNLGTIKLNGAVLIATILSGLDLTGTVLDKETVFIKAQLDGADLTGQTLDQLDFFFANLRGATLDRTSAEGTNFASADLSDTHALAGEQGVSFLGCNLANAKLSGAQLKGARFGATSAASAAVLSGAYMPNADLTSANLVAVDLTGAQWYGPNAKADANLQEANLARANLATMDLNQATLNGADLSFANLVNTNLSGASLAPTAQGRTASLAFASLQGTNFTQAIPPAINLTNAAVALAVTGPVEDFVGVPLFTLPASMSAALTGATVPDDVGEAFAAAGYPLVAAAVLCVLDSGKQWLMNNWDQTGDSGLQAGYGTFTLVLAGEATTISVYGGSPLLVIATDDTNQQVQQSAAFTATAGLIDALDDKATCPSGMRWGMRTRGFDVVTLMTPALPPHPPTCVPSPTHWC